MNRGKGMSWAVVVVTMSRALSDADNVEGGNSKPKLLYKDTHRLGHRTTAEQRNPSNLRICYVSGEIQIASEEYVNLIGELVHSSALYGSYNTKPENRRVWYDRIHFNDARIQFPFDRISALGLLTCPLRSTISIGIWVDFLQKIRCSEKWSPYDVAVFEAVITLFGKNFSKIQKFVRSQLLFCIHLGRFNIRVWKKSLNFTMTGRRQLTTKNGKNHMFRMSVTLLCLLKISFSYVKGTAVVPLSKHFLISSWFDFASLECLHPWLMIFSGILKDKEFSNMFSAVPFTKQNSKSILCLIFTQ